MARVDIVVEQIPQFKVDVTGKPTSVMMEAADYIKLLIRADITDHSLWPPGMEYAADTLERIRQIESDCIKQHGEFDWEKLPEDLQDEYDILCLTLDSLYDTDDYIKLEDYEKQYRGNQE